MIRLRMCCGVILLTVILTGCAGSNAAAGTPNPLVDQETADAAKAAPAGQAEEPINADSQSSVQESAGQDGNSLGAAQKIADGGENFVAVGDGTDIGLEKAQEAALADAGLDASAVTFIKGKLDYDNGRVEYEIEFVTDTEKYEYDVDAADGTILKYSKEAIYQSAASVENPTPAAENPTPAQGMITEEEAKALALAQAGLSEAQVSYTKCELDYDDGVVEYEIEFYADRKEYEVKIDALSGKILEIEIDH